MPKTPTRGRRKTTASTRSSKHLVATPSSVLVAQRAQQKLMRELDFIMPSPLHQMPLSQPTLTFMLTAQDLPEEAVNAIRAATIWGIRSFSEPWQRILELQRWRSHEFAAADAEKLCIFSANLPFCTVVCQLSCFPLSWLLLGVVVSLLAEGPECLGLGLLHTLYCGRCSVVRFQSD